jgi:plasmid stabilization system protein ParE
MKSKPVVALPEVEFDLQGAIAHYESWRSDGRSHILQKYDETISWISWNPESFPKKYGDVQRAILKQSYYIVYFIQESERSMILAVLDGRRKPSIIKGLVGRRRSAKRKD